MKEEKNQVCHPPNTTIDRSRPPSQKIFKLPEHIIVEIFCKIPTKTLIQCQCVCKSWRCLLSDPRFTKDLLSRTPPCLLVFGGSFPMDLLLVDLNNTTTSSPNGLTLKLSKIPLFPATCLRVVNSCDGFLCMCWDWMALTLYIVNPITGESLTLPPRKKKPGSYYCGFGFSPISNVYKVVLIELPYPYGCSSSSSNSNKSEKPEVMVMTVGSGIWRSINNGDSVPAFEFELLQNYGVYLNGFLHWIARCGRKGSHLICAFDVESECFLALPLPPFCSKENFERPTPNLVVLKGWLSINFRSYKIKEETNVWAMKDYGVKESWTQDLDIGCNPLSFNKATQVLNITEEGQVWVLGKFQLQVYTPSLRTRELVPVEFQWDFVHPHIPSFVSLNYAIRG